MKKFARKVVASNAQSDLIIVNVDAVKFPAITMVKSDSLKLNELVIAISNAFVKGHTIIMEIFSALGRSNVGGDLGSES